MARMNRILTRGTFAIFPPCVYGAYHLFSTKLLAKDKERVPPKMSVQLPMATCHCCKKAFKCLMADHGEGDRDCKTINKSRFPNMRPRCRPALSDEGFFSSSLVTFLKGAMVVARAIFADHGRPVYSMIKSNNGDDGNGDEKEDSEEESEEVNKAEKEEAEDCCVRHSAKCAILTKKGDVFCTVVGKDDEEYESPKEEKCFRSEEIARHDYDKVFSGSEKSNEFRKPTFKERKLISYENRLRSFSGPDKIFRYFATLECWNLEEDHEQSGKGYHPDHGARHHEFHASKSGPSRVKVYMNPEDFVRSISPGSLQPSGLGLDLYRAFDPLEDKVVCNLDHQSIFYSMSEDGLLNYSDYMFLLMVLTHPVRHFRMAFNLFDEEGDGTINRHNFRKLERVMLSQTKMGKEHRDHGDNVMHKKGLTSRISKHFFGKDLEENLAVETFVDFQRRLKDEVNSLEIDAYRPDADDSISAMQFVDSMTKYINGNATERNKVKKLKNNMRGYLANLKAADPSLKSPRISREEFLSFNKFLCYPVLMKYAFQSYHAAGIKITRDVFRMNARHIAGVELSDKIVTLLYVMMDDLEENDLNARYFGKMVKTRTTFGLKTSQEQPSFTRKVYAMRNCLEPQYQAFVRFMTSEDSDFCRTFCKGR